MATEPPADLTEETLSSETVFAGDLLRVHRDTVRTPGGAESVREWVAHPGAVAVVPLLSDGTTVLVRQYRYPARRTFVEVPAGKLDAGETPEVSAARELGEEVGLTAATWTKLGVVYPTVGYSDEAIHLFLAEDVEEGEASPDEGEHVVPVRIPFAEAVEKARRGGFTDAKTAVALLLADAVVSGRR
ncbi:MAG TPA: NUDIX hydrolase [Rubricoccaceae bacterium]|jgi:ADP-ribose pyrophosphatase